MRVDPIFADGIDARGIFITLDIRVEQRGNVARAHGIDIEVEDLVGDARKLAQKQPQQCVGSIFTFCIFIAVCRFHVKFGQIVNRDAALRIFAPQRLF